MITLDSKGANKKKATDVDKNSLAVLEMIAKAKDFPLSKTYGTNLEMARTIADFDCYTLSI